MNPPPESNERLRAILESPSYQLAYEDMALLAEDELRPLRFQLELIKPDRILESQGVRSTIVVFGSARVQDSATARSLLAGLERRQADAPDDPGLAQELALARRRVGQAGHYEEARRFARMVSTRFQQAHRCDFVVVTGGGPGIMEAANRGAYDAGARSIGLNITLPHEQDPNPYITPELAFRFQYFALRKMHFLMHAHGLVVFPGGYGTMDELFEVLTLIQTRKMPRIPVILVGREFWYRTIDFEYLADEGYIAAGDLALFEYADRAEEILALLEQFYRTMSRQVVPLPEPCDPPPMS
ncbi:TIGR00730 family Rossman fold protein [Castellaniella sp.]|uniref:LOG family protein n=1 Tax=Castellaniella sp. TaxID=1955812 RepID=UPI00356494F8